MLDRLVVLQSQLETSQALVARMRRMLKSLEWPAPNGQDPYCQVCNCYYPEHDKKCKLAKILRDTKPPRTNKKD
jgi:hypothetical protein